MEVIGQQHDTAHFLGVLHILGQHQHFNFLGAHDLKQVGHRAAVVGQVGAGGRRQVAAVPHGHRFLFPENFVVEPVSQLAAADDQRAGHNVMPPHIGGRQGAEQHPLGQDAHNRQDIIVGQQQTRKLTDAEDVEHRRHHRQAHQVRYADLEQLAHFVLAVQRAVAAFHHIAGHVHQRIQPRDGQKRPDVPHKEAAADRADGAQRARNDKNDDQQYKFKQRVEKTQHGRFVVVHKVPLQTADIYWDYSIFHTNFQPTGRDFPHKRHHFRVEQQLRQPGFVGSSAKSPFAILLSTPLKAAARALLPLRL